MNIQLKIPRHIPLAAQQAPFVVAVEMFGGLGLMLGLGTRIAAMMLSGTMVVALATAAIPDHKIGANWKGLLDIQAIQPGNDYRRPAVPGFFVGGKAG